MKLEVLKTSMPTVLILAQGRATPGNREGSVACTEQGGMSPVTKGKLSVRASHVWLECVLEDETQWGLTITRRHTVTYVTARSLWWDGTCARHIQQDRHASSEEVNGVESQPNHDAAPSSANAGSSLLVGVVNTYLRGDGVSILPNGWPVMGSAVGNQSDRGVEYKQAVMSAKAQLAGGKRNSFCIQPRNRKEGN